MRALLDVNVLIALFDQAHVFNDRAHQWLEANSQNGIATCPITENGLIRILSHRNYSRHFILTPTEVIRRLANFLKQQDHTFWGDSLSLSDPKHFDTDRILGSKQITDIYLLALASKHTAKLVTLDARISLEAATQATIQNLESV